MIGIKMDMPKKCGECPLEMSLSYRTDVFWCPAIRRETTYECHDENRHPGCPLCELPDDGKIRVGDEVTDDSGERYAVTYIWEGGGVDVLTLNGITHSFDPGVIKRTGRHFDEIETLLQKMRGEDDG